MSEISRVFFASDRRVGVIQADGSGECYPEFSVPNQALWHLEFVLPGGRQAVLLSQEAPRNPRAAYHDPDGQAHARTHLWLYDFGDQSLREIGVPSLMRAAGVLPGGQRLLISGNIDHVTYLFSVDLDGGNRADIFTGPGFAYGASVSPDGRQAAYHITGAPGRPGYEIYAIELGSGQRTLIAGDDEFLHFGPLWSPDGQWLLYQRCLYRQDPGHERSDVCVSRADGAEHRVLTAGQSHWFATSFGTPERRGSGSNMPVWSPDGRVTCALLLSGSRTAWQWAADRPDTDHFNRDYRPDLARGGTRICTIDPATGVITPITDDEPPAWSFRLAWSPSGDRLSFVRAEVGRASELWVMDAAGGSRRRLTGGRGGAGVDHPRWG